MKFEFFKAKFMYMLAESANPLFENKLDVGGLTLSYNTDTKVEMSFSSGKWVCVIGLCVDAYGKLNTKEIADRINTFEDIEDSFAFIKRLAGKFVVIQKIKNQLYAIPDATASLPIYYSTNGTIVITSYDEIISKFLRLEKSESALEIRKSGGYGQPFPNNISVCKEIKCVLPNSILNLTDHTVTRFLQFREKIVDRGEQEKIIQKSMDLITEITRGYSKQYSIICPLTAGRDSRLVFAFLEKTGIDFECFTYTGIGVNENVEIPKAICRDKHISHRIIDVEKAEVPYVDSIKEFIGECFSDQMFNYGYTLNKRYSGKAIINGDIIDQIGKSLIGNALPYCAASTTFFMAKLHNYSSKCRDEVKKWMKQIKSGGGRKDIFDYFALDSRMARWATLYSMMYSLCGVPSLNIFNCGELIDSWIALPRKKRADYYISTELLKNIDEQLLHYPVNPGDKFEWMKKNNVLFLIATYLKYFIGLLKSRKSHE